MTHVLPKVMELRRRTLLLWNKEKSQFSWVISGVVLVKRRNKSWPIKTEHFSYKSGNAMQVVKLIKEDWSIVFQ